MTWTLRDQFRSSDWSSGQAFGTEISVSGDYVAVGAPSDDSGKGACYVFKWDGNDYVQMQKLIADDAANGDAFGTSVSMCGTALIVGAPLDDDTETSAGAVYRFLRTGETWSQEQKIVASVPTADGRFGTSVRLCSIGAAIGGGVAPNNGTLWAMEYSGADLVENQIIANPEGSWSNFGASVSIDRQDGLTIAVGCPGSDEDETNGGSVYVYEYAEGSWSNTHRVAPNTPVANIAFGTRVSIDGDTMAVTSAGTTGTDGAYWVFKLESGSWIQREHESLSGAPLVPTCSVDETYSLAVIGDPSDSSSYGVAYLLDGTNNWDVAETVAGGASEGVGKAVCVDGGIVGIGCGAVGYVRVYVYSDQRLVLGSDRQFRPVMATAGMVDGEAGVDTITALGDALNNYVKYAGRPHLIAEMFINGVETAAGTDEMVMLPPWVMVVPNCYDYLMWQVRHERTAGSDSTVWKLYASRDKLYKGTQLFDSTKLVGEHYSTITTSSDTAAISDPAYTSLLYVRDKYDLVRFLVTATNGDGSTTAKLTQLHIWGVPA